MKTSVYVGVSLDGFIARKDGDIGWLTKYESPEVNSSYKEFIKDIDAMVIGRGTYEKVLSFPAWPYEKRVFVLSTSLRQIPGILNDTVSILSLSPTRLLTHLAGLGFKNIYIDGGKVIQGFLREDCVDEIVITKVPMLVGAGIPLFGDLSKDLAFLHISTNVYANGLVKSHYKRDR